MMRNHTRGLILVLATLSLALPAWAQDDAKGYPAITKASKEAVLSFTKPGRVAEILVKEGDAVKAGQLLARQDDTEEQAALKIDQRKADDVTSINAETAVRDQKQADYERMKASKAVGQLELQNAKLEVTVAEARIEMAKAQHDEDQLKLALTKVAVEKLKLYAPNFDGIVAAELLHPFESADGNSAKVLLVVQLDPLRMKVPVPVLKTRTFKEGDVATITLEGGERRTGKIYYIPKVADPGSDTIAVGVEMPNPENKVEGGQTVYVTFGTPPAQIGAAKNP